MTANRRSARRDQPEENASTLKLGEEFVNARCLSISEVCLVLEAVQCRAKNASGKAVQENTLKYVRTFQRFFNTATIKSVRQTLAPAELHQFEIAQMINLCCDDAEEAKALIPSLTNKVDEEALQQLLDELQLTRRHANAKLGNDN